MIKGFLQCAVVWMLAVFVGALFGASYGASYAEGTSMEPTLHNDDIVIANLFDRRATVGAIVSLTCYACGEEGVADGEGLRKRITRKRADNCIWIEGDNAMEKSYDSRWYGWVCPHKTAPGNPEYRIDARIYPITPLNEFLRRHGWNRNARIAKQKSNP